MKKIFTLTLLCSTLYSLGQQDPYYTHFKDVIEAYNPAAAGDKYGEICLSGLTHHQWRDYDDATKARGSNGTPEGLVEDIAPVTYNLNVGSVFKIDQAQTQFVGAGLSLIQDKVGFTASTSFMVNLNYRKKFQDGAHEIVGGIGIGGTQWGWDQPRYVARQLQDEKIPTSGGNETKLDMNLGVMYKKQRLGRKLKDFYAGFSITNVNRATYEISVTTISGSTANLTRDYVPHYYTIVGADYDLNGITLEPAILLKYGLLQRAYVPQVDLNVTALIANTFRGGLAYRQWGNSDALSLLLGYKTGAIEAGYAYDITLSNIQQVSNGTHEIMVKYCIPFSTNTQPKIIRESVRFL